MGIETILFAVFTGIQAISQIQTAKKEAKAVTRAAEARARALKLEGDLATKERAKSLRLRVARQASSFLSSGLTLEGTPEAVLNESFEVGFADIKNIGRNFQTTIDNTISAANAQSKSIVAAGRTAAIGTIVGGFANFSFGSTFAGGTGTAGAGIQASTGTAFKGTNTVGRFVT